MADKTARLMHQIAYLWHPNTVFAVNRCAILFKIHHFGNKILSILLCVLIFYHNIYSIYYNIVFLPQRENTSMRASRVLWLAELAFSSSCQNYRAAPLLIGRKEFQAVPAGNRSANQNSPFMLS